MNKSAPSTSWRKSPTPRPRKSRTSARSKRKKSCRFSRAEPEDRESQVREQHQPGSRSRLLAVPSFPYCFQSCADPPCNRVRSSLRLPHPKMLEPLKHWNVVPNRTQLTNTHKTQQLARSIAGNQKTCSKKTLGIENGGGAGFQVDGRGRPS